MGVSTGSAPTAWKALEGPLPNARIGIVPLLFANDDLPDLTPAISAETMLDEIARLGYAGTQLSRVFPSGKALHEAMATRRLRVAEVYAALPCDEDGPPAEAIDLGRTKIRELIMADADVLILSYHLSAGRVERAGRALQPGTPRLTGAGWRRAVATLHELAAEAEDTGRVTVYHPHVGTYVETPDEVDHLLEMTDSKSLGLCLDVGHYTLGGGNAVEGLRRYGERVKHIHFKDVDAQALSVVRADTSIDFYGALRRRIFTELGFGVLDVPAIVDHLIAMGYKGWIMCEQDTSWWPAAESAAISRRVLDFALREGARRQTAKGIALA